MFEGIHEARTDEFRRVLRACALACSKGRQAVVLAVPRDQDPSGFLRAFYRHVVKKGGRPVRFVETGWALDAALGVGDGERDGSFLAALDARERRFERRREALERDLATDDEAGGPGLLILDANPAHDPDLRAFLVYLSPRGCLWQALGGPRAGRAVVVTAVPSGPSDEECKTLEGIEVLRIRPIEARDVRAASEAAVDLWWGHVVGQASSPSAVGRDGCEEPSVSVLIAAGAYEAALARGPTDARTRLWCLVAVGRADVALDEAYALPPGALTVDDLIGLGHVVLARARVKDALDLASRAEDLSAGGDATSLIAGLRAEAALVQSDLAEAARWAAEAVRRAEGPDAWARAWNVTGKVAFRAGRHDEADIAFRRVGERVRDTDAESVRAAHNRALVALRRGDHARAAALLQEAAIRAGEAGLVFGAAVTRHNLAVAFEHLGKYRAAWQFASEAADRFARLGRTANLAGALHTIADLLVTFGEWDRAAALLDRAEGIAKEAGLEGLADLCVRTRGEADLARGDPVRAVERLDGVRQRLESRGLQDDADLCSARLAEALFEAGRFAEARREAEAVIGRGRGARDEATGRAFGVLGRCIRVQDGPAEALSALTRAREVLEASGQKEPMARVAVALAEALRDLGDTSAAKELDDEARALLDEVAAQVPEEFRKSFEKRAGTLEGPGAGEAPAEPTPRTSGVESLPVRPRLRHLLPHIVGDSPALNRVLVTIERVRNVAVPVLLAGESGTGKELFAEALHRLSSRASGPFVRVNAAAFTDSLLLSELFGHEKGAFTDAHARKIGRFEAAHGGTLFLDEIGDVSERLQSALLRVLEDQSFQRVGGVETVHVDVRLVFATNRDLGALMKAGRFREDLYHRISGVVVRVPPLRERLEDIPALTEEFVREAGREAGRTISVTREALALLQNDPWPGNVRELRNVVRRACLLMDGPVLTPEVLAREVPGIGRGARPEPGSVPDAADAVFGRGLSMDEALRETEVALIREALARTGGNIAAAARLLGVKRPRLSQMVKEHDLKATAARGKP